METSSSYGSGEAIETCVEATAGRSITDDERRTLAKHGLADKSRWYDSDSNKVWNLLNFVPLITIFVICVDRPKRKIL
jgi:hypothetical protein